MSSIPSSSCSTVSRSSTILSAATGALSRPAARTISIQRTISDCLPDVIARNGQV